VNLVGYRYIGAKSKIIDEVLNGIGEIVGKEAHITDLMCGTAAVCAALREQGYQVTANDIMTYPYHHARVVLHFTKPPEFEGAKEFISHYGGYREQISLFPPTPYIQMLNALNNVPAIKGYFWQEFSMAGTPRNTDKPRNYFTPENAMKIDGIRFHLAQLQHNRTISDLEYSLLIHDLIMASNDVANIAGTYGHYLSKTVARASVPVELTPTALLLLDDKMKHTVLQGSAEEVAGKISCDLCYIDPPYMKRQYAANYHLLETLARGDEPEAIGVSGLRPWRDQYSNFCTKTKIRDSFRRIFSDMDCPHFLVSYSEDGLLSIQDLVDLFSEFGVVTVTKFLNKRFKSNDSRLGSTVTEYLLHLNKKEAHMISKELVPGLVEIKRRPS